MGYLQLFTYITYVYTDDEPVETTMSNTGTPSNTTGPYTTSNRLSFILVIIFSSTVIRI